MQNRSGRLILNSIYSVLAWLMPVALGLLVTPFLLRRLGVEAYGIYLVILGFIGYSFTFSISKAVAKFVSEFGASGDTRKISSTITGSFLLSLAIGIVGFAVIAILADWAVKDLLQISTSFQRPAKAAMMIGGASIPFILVGQVFQNILHGSHRFGALSVITNINWALLNAGNVTLVIFGFGIDALLIWTVIVAVATAAISFLTARRAQPDYKLDFRSAGEMIRPVISYGSSIFLYQFFGSLMLVFERAWLTRNFGAETASYYLVPMALVFYFHAFMGNLTAATFPVMNELISDRIRLLELYKKSTKLVVSLAVLFIVSAYFGGQLFLTLWIDGQFAASSSALLTIHALTFGSIVVMMAVWQINEVFRAARLNSLLAGIWALVTIVLMLVLAEHWGAEGIAIARTIGVTVTLPAIFLIERKFFGAVQWSFWLAIAVRVILAAIFLSVIEYIIFSRVGAGWSDLFLGLSLGAIGYGVILYLTGFISHDEKDALLRALGFRSAAVQ